MNHLERYTFDLNGYLLVKGILSPSEVARALAATDALESRFACTVHSEPRFAALKWKGTYHYDAELGTSSYQAHDNVSNGPQYVVDDFLNADPAFDLFVGHPRTIDYIQEMTESPFQIAGSELRYRHKGSITGTHMGGPIDARNEYRFVPHSAANERASQGRSFDLLTVRVLYALHDVPVENGPLCVVPGSHKANYLSPYGDNPLEEPGMIPLPMAAGDALFFTENLRHGGYPNVVDRVRKTVHLTYAPNWVGSQSPAHHDGVVHVTREAWSRYSDKQRAFLPKPGENGPLSPQALSLESMRARIEALERRNAELEANFFGRRALATLRRLLAYR
jgi:hypothetical protein